MFTSMEENLLFAAIAVGSLVSWSYLIFISVKRQILDQRFKWILFFYFSSNNNEKVVEKSFFTEMRQLWFVIRTTRKQIVITV